MFRIVFNAPEIPGNSGNAIRLSAITGAELHLVKPLGFNFEDANLRRAGLDYHDLAFVTVHENLDAAFEALGEGRVFAYTSEGETIYSDISYEPSDILLFGKESVGLSAEDKQHPRVTDLVKLPMLPGRRSLNLANAASIVAFEAWRQHGFAGA
ncbi:tRNA (cytidine(34)-2'-O)-methyltransferase [Glutamicibacter protophormiae]|uniref:Putative tRNA (cytidine(34)-2'-O)-methyltransferase n=1 Tax=Glutamicibacter protophormiae TaxID=37930 RepID=A0ABS4XUI9_GLUPR|nr:tRNA (cytidine(34)-2'-O)-methyltransferase [Glutamicibacter protophormiae]MBP2400169.1 tRNA (cytidine/uridine-2'-O-)-methyltransferase [Glutamicibacter protophormiae]QRQ77483.1 tRNA (cytidine(34)-2'-O)-methyltransferase [Glutamicibacter protophormiae]WPR63469.1 tRNA (cytidine(34)-2'-O)-methyltransferase [Glutamicibacter protophormiae]WPR66965.1 tRNA (cytidine(34)-2'-O)-methyltransferase [Glutamicibacter protophormiae]GGL74759.1 putative tRNA (cytidine(34)-2'-O)-methyltransferase [Glutamicib